MSTQPGIVKASDFMAWWAKLNELIAAEGTTGADLSPTEHLRDVLLIYGDRAGAVRTKIQSDTVPAQSPMKGDTWGLTFDYVPSPDINWQQDMIDLQRRDPRDNSEPDPEHLIKAIEQATGIPRSE